MRVIFMGTPDFSVPVLEAVAAEHEVVCVYCQPPRPAGRGKKLRPSPVQARAEALGLPVRYPTRLRDAEAQQDFVDLQADVAVVVAYGLILPQAVLDAPRLGCVNIHASLLPRWRGAAPIHRAIMAGDDRTGVCIMQMEAGLDTGPVLMREATDIGATETTGDLHDRLSQMGARLIGRVLPQLETLSPVAQPDQGVTYADKIDKAEGGVDFTLPATGLARQVNGLSPFPGAFVLRDGARIKLLRAETCAGQGAPGTVLDAPGLVVACGDGALSLLEVQPAGRGPMAAEEWRRGARVEAGQPFASVET
ncbi:methionyl-tRNA formyltransferase [Jannaschia pagri]|uniref:Methionyl-tRNA formyltransferase n=1 Tax=Jannaschia pagri TaxID=2829797 RepID=A0ABQ4NGZ1_9RHOB|nr:MULTISPECIES: methionyl-tRNA formyltransferase [unclassified Jannaschia]GIT90197.1 methionyl-tRNA formyltransferase [Jannaschia sp. AI_61]GIT93697.1 methionyl-tRNA formyltransferase [Jannaschia sp. AI_62]